MIQPSGTKIKNGLTADEVRFLANWFRDSYEAGWRPTIHAPVQVQALATKLDGIYDDREKTNQGTW